MFQFDGEEWARLRESRLEMGFWLRPRYIPAVRFTILPYPTGASTRQARHARNESRQHGMHREAANQSVH